MGPRMVVSKRVESEKLYSIFSRIKARNRVGGSTWDQNVAPKSMEDETPYKERHENQHQKENTEIWTALVPNEPMNNTNSGVKRSPNQTNKLNTEMESLPEGHESNRGYKGTTEPEQSLNNFQTKANQNLVFERATEEDLGQQQHQKGDQKEL